MKAIAGYFPLDGSGAQPAMPFFHSIALDDADDLIRLVAQGGTLFGACRPTERFDVDEDIADYLVLTAGEILNPTPVDWDRILHQLRANRHDLPTFSGRFAACVYDRASQSLHLISDHLSQFPLYYTSRRGEFAFSTSQASFIGLPRPPEFDVRWLYDQFAFNFSPTHLSFLHDVRRMPAGSILTIDLRNGDTALREYAGRIKPATPVGPVKRQVEHAVEVFHERAAAFVNPGERLVAGLSGGFDSRAILALFMDQPGFHTFTYGVPGCRDIEAARLTASSLGIPHHVVHFDEEFELMLPTLAAECVWRSGGLQPCIRSTLLHAYRTIADIAGETPALLSGVSGDQLFRGHGNVPSIVSPLLNQLFKGEAAPSEAIASLSACMRDHDAYRAHVAWTVDELVDEFGPLDRSTAAMGYLTYVVPAEYFSGEAVLADSFTHFRTPFCDPGIVRLAYEISLSSLAFSKFAGRQDILRKNYLPANLIAMNPRLRGTQITDRPLMAFAHGNRPYYLLASAWSAATRPFRSGPYRKPPPPLEDWTRWFAGPLRLVALKLLTDEARIRQFVSPTLISGGLSNPEPRLLSKLLSAEILLRLIESGWRLERLYD